MKLLDFIEAIEKKLNIKAKKNFLPLQAGDVPQTFANVEDLINDIQFKPETNIQDGIDEFIEWYVSYYKKNIEAGVTQ